MLLLVYCNAHTIQYISSYKKQYIKYINYNKYLHYGLSQKPNNLKLKKKVLLIRGSGQFRVGLNLYYFLCV